MSYEEALEALKEGKYKEVLKWFEGLPPAKRDGKSCALAALSGWSSASAGAGSPSSVMGKNRASGGDGSSPRCRAERRF